MREGMTSFVGRGAEIPQNEPPFNWSMTQLFHQSDVVGNVTLITVKGTTLVMAILRLEAIGTKVVLFNAGDAGIET